MPSNSFSVGEASVAYRFCGFEIQVLFGEALRMWLQVLGSLAIANFSTLSSRGLMSPADLTQYEVDGQYLAYDANALFHQVGPFHDHLFDRVDDLSKNCSCTGEY